MRDINDFSLIQTQNKCKHSTRSAKTLLWLLKIDTVCCSVLVTRLRVPDMSPKPQPTPCDQRALRRTGETPAAVAVSEIVVLTLRLNL